MLISNSRFFSDGRVLIANAGDSRAVLFRTERETSSSVASGGACRELGGSCGEERSGKGKGRGIGKSTGNSGVKGKGKGIGRSAGKGGGGVSCAGVAAAANKTASADVKALQQDVCSDRGGGNVEKF